jgi:hypothetical protein
MYKKHFKLWGLEKNLKADESIAMLRIEKRRMRENKKTFFRRRGKLVKLYNLRRFAKRRGLTVHHDAQGTSLVSAWARSPERLTPMFVSGNSPKHHVWNARTRPIQQFSPAGAPALS